MKLTLKRIFFPSIGICRKIKVELSNDAYDVWPSKAGTYTLQGEINDRMYWVKTDGKNAIWYYPEYKDWLIGSIDYLGNNRGGILSKSNLETEFPYDEVNTWKYVDADSNWIDTDDIKITCY